jgi:hypothetical protein
MFMTASAYGTKLASAADHDLEFLDVIAATASGATISGVLELDESDAAHIGRDISPLANIALRFSTGDFVTTVLSSADGHFSLTGLPPGAYKVGAQLPDDLILSDNRGPGTAVLKGGCASMRLRVVPNGSIRGFVTDTICIGRSGVDLMPADLGGRADRYSLGAECRAFHSGVRPGRYARSQASSALLSEYRTGWRRLVLGRSERQDVGEFRPRRRQVKVESS